MQKLIATCVLGLTLAGSLAAAVAQSGSCCKPGAPCCAPGAPCCPKAK